MDEAPNMYLNLNDQQQFRLNEISEVEAYFFISEIHERKLMSKWLSKCITSCDYFDKSLTVLSAISGSFSIVSFANVIRAPVEITSADFSFTFSTT